MHSRRNTHELRIDIALPVAHHDQLRSAAEKIAGNRRRLDPSMGFLVFNVARSARRHPLARPRPDACVHHAEQRIVIGIDRNHRMAEKAQRLPITRGTKAFAAPIPTLEVDLSGVLRRHDASSGTRRCSSSPCRLHHLFGLHMGRSQEAAGRQLSGSTAARRAQHQRAGGHHPLKQIRSCLLSTHVAKITDAKRFFCSHHCLRSGSKAVNHNAKPRGNREYFSHGLLTATSINADHRIKSANAVAPCGRGHTPRLQRRRTGEGFVPQATPQPPALAARTPHPSESADTSALPSPTRGEGTRCECRVLLTQSH